MKHKTKDSGGCPFSKVLRKMPPLAHYPNPGGRFYISGSDVVRFIIFTMGETKECTETRGPASSVFYKASMSGVLVFEQGMWRGRAYVKGQQSSRICDLMRKMKEAQKRRCKWRKKPGGGS